MFYYIWATECEFCKQITTPLIERLMDEGNMIFRIEQDSQEYETFRKKHNALPDVTPLFFNDESGHYLRGATYATYYNLSKLIKGGEVMNYETNMYSGEEIKTLPELKTNEPVKPTTLGMARNLAKDMWSSVKGKASGEDVFADKEKAKLRWEICQSCPFLDKGLNRCKACGCLMKAKVHLEHVECPEKKW